MMNNTDNIVGRMQHLFDLWGKFDRVYFKILQKHNLSYNSYLVLEELLHHPEGGEAAFLADRLNIPRQTMTFILDHLERDGTIERLPHPADRRRKLLKFTSAGQHFAQTICHSIFERELEAMQTLSTNEQEQLITLYDKLQKAFEKSFSE